MAYYYNETAFNAVTNVYTLFQISNDLVQQRLALLVLFVIFLIVLFFSNRQLGLLSSLPLAGFVTTISALLFFALNLIAVSFLIYPFVILLIGVFVRVLFWDTY